MACDLRCADQFTKKRTDTFGFSIVPSEVGPVPQMSSAQVLQKLSHAFLGCLAPKQRHGSTITRIWAELIRRKGCVSGADKLPQTLSLTQDVPRHDKLLETGFSGAFFSNMTRRHGMCEWGLNDHTTRQSATVRSA